MGDELTIDLRRYLNVMIRRRRLILFLAFVSLVAAGLGRLLFPPPFEAVAGVAIVKFPISYEAVAGVEAVQAQAELPSVQPQANPESFRQLLKGLVRNPAIAQVVISRLKDRLRPEDRDPSYLMEKVEGDIFKSGPDQGDLIFIKVRDPDSVYAAEIANAWAEEYERYVNRIYEGGSGESQEMAPSELERARREYESAQRTLEAYLADNPLDELGQRMDQLEKIVGTLHSQRLDALASMIQKRISTRLALAEKYLDAYNTSMTVSVAKELETQIGLLSYLHAARLENERVLEEARALRSQVAQGGDPSARSNSLALVLLKAQAFAGSGNLPGDLQLVLGGVGDLQQGASGQIADLNALIAALEARQKRLDEEIAEQIEALQSARWAQIPELNTKDHPLQRMAAQAFDEMFELKDLSDLIPQVEDTPLSRLIAEHTAEMDRIRSQREQAEARKRELVHQRDLAWSGYTMLSKKYVELNVALKVTGDTVRFALPATPPLHRTISTSRILGISGLLGLFVGVFLAFLIEGMGMPEPPPPLWGPPNAPWNRIWRWVLSPAPGVAGWDRVSSESERPSPGLA